MLNEKLNELTLTIKWPNVNYTWSNDGSYYNNRYLYYDNLKSNVTNYNINYDSKNKKKIKWVSSYMKKERKRNMVSTKMDKNLTANRKIN